MTTQDPQRTPRRRTPRRSFALLLAASLATSVSAADWFLDKNQPRYSSWDTLADWKPAADGTGTSPTALSTADTYRLNGFSLRTPEGGSTYTFGGGQLVLDTTGDTLLVKTTGAGLSIFPSLLTSAGVVQHSGSGTKNIQVGAYENRSGVTSFNVPSGYGLSLAIGTLTGSGQFRLHGGGTHYLDAGAAEAYDGDIYIQSGTVDFQGDFGTAGTLTVNTGAKVHLDQSVTFTGLTVDGTEYPVGNYSYAYLAAQHPAVFLSGTSAGFLNVRAPADWYLSVNQPVGASWDTLSHWKSNPDGTGSSPVSINSFDNYINQTSGRNVRSPEADSTFGGGALVLSNGGKLVIKSLANQASSVPTLVTSGGAIGSGFNGIAQTLVVGEWNIGTGNTVITTSSTGSINLEVHHLHGAGSITVGSNSHVLLKVDHGAQLTGDFTVNAGGSLALGQTLGLGGGLVLQSGATVALGDHWLYVRSLTVGGVAKAPGIHSAASLGAAFSGTGSVVVYTPTSDSPQMFGVNIAGGDFMPTVFWQTSLSTWQYYNNKGLTLIRLPFRWHRIQSPLNSTVNFTQIDQCLAHASALGMKVILDVHDYGKYGGQGNSPKIGSASVPVSAFVNLWSQIADKYKDNDTIYGYDLMNEPLLDFATWTDAAQQAVDAIRKKDAKRYILVEGLGASNAQHFRPDSASQNRFLDIRDPIGRIIYSAHSYWDYQGIGSDGTYQSNDVPHPQIGVNHVKPFVEWLKNERPYAFGNVGEFCVPNNYYQAGWNEALGNFLQYIRDNGMSATYWAGGANWSASSTVCHPQPFPGTDKPQMSVLELYHN